MGDRNDRKKLRAYLLSSKSRWGFGVILTAALFAATLGFIVLWIIDPAARGGRESAILICGQVILLLFIFAFAKPRVSAFSEDNTDVNRVINGLELERRLSQAAAELDSESTVKLWNDRIRCSEHFLYSREPIFVLPWSKVAWCYQRAETGKQKVYIWTDGILPYILPAADNSEISGRELLIAVVRHSEHTLIGFNRENEAEWERRRKAGK